MIALDDVYSKFLITQLQKYGLHNCTIILKAMQFTKFYHQGQKRKSGHPYYSHPIAVAAMVLPHKPRIEIISAALMHDVVEDTKATIEQINKGFGQRIAIMVDRLTRDRPDSEKLTVKEILHNAYQYEDTDVLLIKICDRLHNLETIKFMNQKKQKEILTETQDARFLGFAAEINFNLISEISRIIYGAKKIIDNKGEKISSLEF